MSRKAHGLVVKRTCPACGAGKLYEAQGAGGECPVCGSMTLPEGWNRRGIRIPPPGTAKRAALLALYKGAELGPSRVIRGPASRIGETSMRWYVDARTLARMRRRR